MGRVTGVKIKAEVRTVLKKKSWKATLQLLSKKQKKGFRRKETEETTMVQISHMKTCDIHCYRNSTIVCEGSAYKTLKDSLSWR